MDTEWGRRRQERIDGASVRVRPIELRLDANDEYMHDAGDETTFNESMYVNVYDPEAGIGGFFRLGNRPNEGRGEMTACLFLGGGRVGFAFDRPEISDNDRLSAGGLAFEVDVPFERLRVSYDGLVALLDDPLSLADPKAALTGATWAGCKVELSIAGRSTPFGGEPDQPVERPGEEFARGHYEQLVEVEGSFTIDGDPQVLTLHGFGLRDHSWGPRTWQAPWYYRWCTANFGKDRGFCATRIARRDGGGIRGGFLWADGNLRTLTDVRVTTTWDGDPPYQAALSLELSAGDERWHVDGKVLRLVPLRNRRRDPQSGEQLITRIAEGLTEWSLDDGTVGYGLAEYLDQLVEGVPVGLSE